MHRKSAVVIQLHQVVVGIALAAFLGCVHTEHPLNQSGKVIVDPELVGEWILIDDPIWERDASRDNRIIGIQVTLIGEDLYRFNDLEGDPDHAYDAKLVEAEGKTYLVIQHEDTNSTEHGCFWLPSFIQFERKGDWIALRTPNAIAFRKHLKAATEINGEWLSGYPFSVTVTSSSDELARFLAKHGDDVLHRRQVFRRKDIP